MFKKTVIAAGIAMLLGTTGAMADTFTFDPSGTAGASGNIGNLTTFDQSPGNALAVGGGGVLQAGQQITLLYQANLGTVIDQNGVIAYTNGTAQNGVTHYFTFVAGFGEYVNGAIPPNLAAFGFDSSNPVNFFKVYENSVSAGNDLTGAGFTAGTLILSGTILPDNYTSSFQRSGSGTSKFDNHGSDDYAGFQSIIGSGSTSLTARVDSVDTNYFPDLLLGSVMTQSLFSTTSVVPFATVDPSRAFVNTTGTASAVTAPNLGSQNGGAGSGPNFQLQADASQTFFRNAVPEPDSLLLMGLGLGAVGLAGKRRRKLAA